VRALVAGGADPGRVAGDGRTPQHARAGGHDVIASALKAAIDTPSMNRTDAAAALLSAAAEGNAGRVAVALRDGATLESRDGRGRTALLLAATNDRLDVARLLVVLGADPNAQDDQRDSAWLVTGVTGSVAKARFGFRSRLRPLWGELSEVTPWLLAARLPWCRHPK
jgi:uncharacterized protein